MFVTLIERFIYGVENTYTCQRATSVTISEQPFSVTAGVQPTQQTNTAAQRRCALGNISARDLSANEDESLDSCTRAPPVDNKLSLEIRPTIRVGRVFNLISSVEYGYILTYVQQYLSFDRLVCTFFFHPRPYAIGVWQGLFVWSAVSRHPMSSELSYTIYTKVYPCTLRGGGRKHEEGINMAIHIFFTGDHSKQDLWCSQKPTWYIFTYLYQQYLVLLTTGPRCMITLDKHASFFSARAVYTAV